MELLDGIVAFDTHVHLPTTEWIEGCVGVYAESVYQYFHSKMKMRSLEEMIREYEEASCGGLVLGWDAERATGAPKLDDALVARVCELSERRFVGFGSVDPLRDNAIDDLRRLPDLGLRGVKLHPGIQHFDPASDDVQPFFDEVAELGLMILTHAGISGLGARTPGGQGIRIDLAHPMRYDRVAARLPSVNIMLAHLGGPWIDESVAMALHKTNVYLDVSGWKAKYLPGDVLRSLRGRLSGQICFGSDYPIFSLPESLSGCAGLDLSDELRASFLRNNAAAYVDGVAAA